MTIWTGLNELSKYWKLYVLICVTIVFAALIFSLLYDDECLPNPKMSVNLGQGKYLLIPLKDRMDGRKICEDVGGQWYMGDCCANYQGCNLYEEVDKE